MVQNWRRAQQRHWRTLCVLRVKKNELVSQRRKGGGSGSQCARPVDPGGADAVDAVVIFFYTFFFQGKGGFVSYRPKIEWLSTKKGPFLAKSLKPLEGRLLNGRGKMNIFKHFITILYLF